MVDTQFGIQNNLINLPSCRNIFNSIQIPFILLYSRIKNLFSNQQRNCGECSVLPIEYHDTSLHNDTLLSQTLITSLNQTLITSFTNNNTIIYELNNSETQNETIVNNTVQIINKKCNLKILYFALIINPDEIKQCLDNNDIDLNKIFLSDLTFKSEYHITLWYVASLPFIDIKSYYTDIKNFIGTIQSISITEFSYNSQYSRLNISFSDLNNLSTFYKNELIQPHITLVHPGRDAKGAGMFIPTTTINLNFSLQTQIAIIVKDQHKIKTITSIDDLNLLEF
jgi:hypothetical protein